MKIIFFYFLIKDYFDMCSFLEIMVSIFLITCVLARWILPIKIKLRRDDLSALLISFMINGTDITKFLAYLDENYIIVDLTFVYLILGKKNTFNYLKKYLNFFLNFSILFIKCFSI